MTGPSRSRRILIVLVAVLVVVLVGFAVLPRQPVPQRAGPPDTPGASTTPTGAASPTGGAGSTPAPGSGMARYTSQRLQWRACAERLECTTALAPLDYSRPEVGTVTLALARRPATGGRIGSLFINPGGPGGSGVSYAQSFEAKGLERFDIVGWDPRGVGQSTRVRCFDGPEMDAYLAGDVSPDDAREVREQVDRDRAFGRSCLERSGELLRHISTVDTVRDLDLLRGLVGDRRLFYFGSSYGTQIGATYAHLFGQRAGRLVLDGAVDITDAPPVSQAEGFDRALNAFASWCARRNCRLGESRRAVLEGIVGLLDRLDREPIRVGQRELTQSLGVTAVIYPLYGGEQAWEVLQAGLERAVTGDDGRVLLALADAYNERGRNGEYGSLQFSFNAIRCLDGPRDTVAEARREAAEARRKAPTVGQFGGADLICPLWPVPVAPKPPKLTGPNAPPIVVIGTTGDPATPYEYAVSMAEQLKSAVLVTYRGEGHLAYGQSTCVRELVVDYLVAGEVPKDGTTCTR